MRNDLPNNNNDKLDLLIMCPKGDDKQIFSSMPKHDHVKSRVGSFDKINHVPQGGDVRIYNEKLNFRETATPKITTYSNSSACGSSLSDEDRYLVYSPISQENEDIKEVDENGR